MCVNTPEPISKMAYFPAGPFGLLMFFHGVHLQVDMTAVLRHLSRRGQPPAEDFQHEKYSEVLTVISFGNNVAISKCFCQNLLFFSDIQHSHKEECIAMNSNF